MDQTFWRYRPFYAIGSKAYHEKQETKILPIHINNGTILRIVFLHESRDETRDCFLFHFRGGV